MRSYVELIGHVARRPEIRLHANGDRHALMVVETREEWRDRNSGEQRSRSTWHDVKVTKAGLVKAIERQLTGGELVFVTGTLRYSDWVDGQNVQRRTSEVSVKAPEHHVLIPQGSRLIGDYDADVAFGQSRILLAWNRLILPDGRSIVLERQPASDPRGFAGLQDGTDYHWGGVLKAALISTLLGAGSELGSGDDGNLARAFRRGTQDSINRAGEQIVSRELNVRPTLTIRPGFPVRVLVTRDLVLGGGQ